jgi:hypothetical protein
MTVFTMSSTTAKEVVPRGLRNTLVFKHGGGTGSIGLQVNATTDGTKYATRDYQLSNNDTLAFDIDEDGANVVLGTWTAICDSGTPSLVVGVQVGERPRDVLLREIAANTRAR